MGTTSTSSRISLLAALVCGALLRVLWLPDDILTGDELHAVKAAVEWPLGKILTTWTYYRADYGIPLAALFHIAMDLGVRLGELELRTPALLAGTLSIALMPWLARERLSPRAARVLPWLLALSPLLVLYSRMVRTYAPAILFAFIAVIYFDRWWRSRERRAALGYAASSALAVWFNLTTAPLVAAPMLYAALRIGLERPIELERLRALASVGALAALVVALPLLPAIGSFTTLEELHGRGAAPTLTSWLEIVRMHAGTGSGIVAAVMLAALGRGAWIVWRRDRDWLLYIGTLAALHFVGLALLGPDQLDNPIVLNRYLLSLLPFGLCFVAEGLAAPLRHTRATRSAKSVDRLQIAAGVVLAAALLATGPLLERHYARSSFSNAPVYTYFVRDGNTIAEAKLPAFYRRFSPDAESEIIIEYPWSNIATNAFDAYQKHHEQPILGAPIGLSLLGDGLNLRRMVEPRASEYLASPARWLAVHLDLRAEERRIHTSDRNHWIRLEEWAELWPPLQRLGPLTASNLERLFGPADYDEDSMRVWDLDRLRRERR